MFKQAIYNYKDYKRYVLDGMNQGVNKGRGQRKLLADAIGCQTPFITHVLSGDYHFSAEQAEACARWLGLGETEAEFFVLLVLKQRASTRALESLWERQLAFRRERATTLKKRLDIKKTLSSEIQTVYCSSWHYAAAHMAILIPRLRNVEALQKYFRWSAGRTREVVDFLVQNGLVEAGRQGLAVLQPVLHFDKKSPLLNQYLSHWRLRAVDSIPNKIPMDLHYSGVISLSADDFDWAREKVSETLAEIIGRVRDSKDEKLAVLNLDWFELL